MRLVKRPSLLWRAVAALTFLCAGSRPSSASTVIYRTDAELVALSERVVHARVLGVRSASGSDGEAIYTVTTVAVLEDLTGIAGDTLDIWELGGVLGDRFFYVGGQVRFKAGDEVVVFLERGPRGLRSVAMGFSTFDAFPDGTGDATVIRRLGDTTVAGAPPGGVRPTAKLSEFRALTERIKGVRSRTNRAADALVPQDSAVQAFTLLTFGNGLPVRWVEADSGTPVRWFRNTSASSPLLSGDGTSEIQTALAGWTNPLSASIVLQYGGTTFQSNAEGPFSGLPAGPSGVITFEDPNNEISGSVLAIGGGSGQLGGGGTINGQQFNRFTSGYVVFQNAANLSSNFRQSTDFSRVLEHEIGHGIGLGHTQQDGSVSTPTANIMYASCCSANTPVPPAIGPDDLAGLNFVYPAGSTPPPPSCSYTVTPGSSTFSFSGGSGAVTVATSDPGCAWTAVSNAGFVSITSGSSGSGNGSVTYTVAANPSTAARAGTMLIAGQSFTVNQFGAPVRRPSVDFDGDRVADIGVFRPVQATWYIRNQSAASFGQIGDLPVPGDYNGDGRTEVAVFRPSTGTWLISGSPSVVWGRPGDIPVPADYDGNGITDIAVFRPSTGTWYVRNQTTFVWGMAGDLPVPADYNGDGIVDAAVYRPATGSWLIRNQGTFAWGFAADVPVPADYNGDGIADIAVFRPATGVWYVRNQFTDTWGAAGDVPVALDRNGDGRAELGVFRRATGTWYFKDESSGGTESFVWGAAGDIPLGRALPPVAATFGDFDGDRKADLTVFRPSTGDWVSLRSLTGQSDYTLQTWGLSTDVAVARDYDGDGKIDPTVFRPSTGRWYVRRSSTGYTDYIAQDWGLPSDIPVPADYDGDGKADFAVFRPSEGNWYILLSSTGNTSYVTVFWGANGDVPAPADYDGDGRADLAVFRPSAGRWFILNRFTGATVYQDWGVNGDLAAAADYDGDGKADIAVFRPSLGRWFLLSSIDGSTRTVDWGLSGDVVVSADYNGDGFADIAVFRPSTGYWYVYNVFSRSWGLAGGDIAALKNP